jgi:hypothetical protein
MNEDQQIATIIAAAKVAPKKIGVFVDDHKETRFLQKLRAGLPAADFQITVHPGLTRGTKTIIIKREAAKQFDPANN